MQGLEVEGNIAVGWPGNRKGPETGLEKEKEWGKVRQLFGSRRRRREVEVTDDGAKGIADGAG
ncbi:hypothetical protein HPP92_011427 [Vanilla planifolia]|uniref:Uncharacterized protein n=1 Tax=Vanilla planifolia TaxID=51239 RepID=A0A835R469_VANPL|nr:hypothetical protein HPP92_011427 [Vanilla planifolia]